MVLIMNMIVTPPNFKKPVFVRALRDVGDIDVAEYVPSLLHPRCSQRLTETNDSGHTLTLSKGSIHLVPYQAVREQMVAGDVELL